MSKFTDYKIQIVQSSNYTEKNVASIEDFHNVMALIDKNENAAEILKPLFEKEIERLKLENQPIPKSGSGKAKITFASNDKIEKLRPFIDEFWNKVLGTSYLTSFVSDESYFRDWEHYLDSENKTITDKVIDIYGIDIESIYDKPIHVILTEIKKADILSNRNKKWLKIK